MKTTTTTRRWLHQLIILFALCNTTNGFCQLVPGEYPGSFSINYARNWTARMPESDASVLKTKTARDVLQSTLYFDGLGRPVQTVVRQSSLETSSGILTDLVVPVVYDQSGREQYKYLPFAANNSGNNTSVSDGAIKLNPFQQQAAFYGDPNGILKGQGETYYYSKTDFELSPLDRVLKSMPAGNSWTGSSRGTNFRYWLNTQADDVKKWSVLEGSDGWGNYSVSGTYAANELYKNVSIDEHGKQVEEFKDKEDKIILKKVQLTASVDNGSGSGYQGWLCIYYIYDDLNNLRCIIQPEGVRAIAGSWQLTPLLLNEQCFRYEYDGRNRMIMKKLPGSAAIYMVYDRWDRLILTQDGVQRANNLWIFTKYDRLNRPILTGFHWDDTHTSLGSIMHHVKTNESWLGRYEDIDWTKPFGYTTTQTYPYATASTILVATHYDDYTGIPPGFSASFMTTWNNNFSSTDNINWPYPQMPSQSNAIKGSTTWTQTMILNTTPAKYLTSVNIYDDKDRLIQVQRSNITEGIDVATNQYSWLGQPLVTVLRQQKGGGITQENIIVSKTGYDDLGQVTVCKKMVSNTTNGNTVSKPEQEIVSNQYDKLGQLKIKKIAPSYDGGIGLETFNYDYNIRGWIVGMNRNYLRDNAVVGYTDSFFGFELGYDKTSTAANSSTYHAAQYNGNIAGTVWKSKGDQVRRKYDFEYDANNRLTRAGYSQNSSATAGGSWNWTEGNFSVHGFDADNNYGIKYDDNGNILMLVQHGIKNMNPDTYIDALRYVYQSGSNRLDRVYDEWNDPNTSLSDFKDGSNGSGTDYSYDANGNLVVDNNKSISNIAYNHLNLPVTITVTGKGTITYTYDATGIKLKKVMHEPATAANNNISTTITTLYIGGTVYESRTDNNPNTVDHVDKLQFITHEEGRIRAVYNSANPNLLTDLAYDYMIKDHLGNVRMLLTEEQRQDVYPAATLENTTHNGNTALSEEDDFYSIDPSKIVDQSAATGIPVYQNNNGNPPYNNNPYSNYTANSTRLYKLNAATNAIPDKTGLGIVLKVMAGDAINIFGKSYHKKPASGYTTPINSIPVIDLITAFAGSPLVVAKGITGNQITGQPGFPSAISGLIGNQPPQSSDRPRASINWIILDEQFKWSGGGFDMVGAAVDNNGTFKTHDPSTIPTISIPKNGYIYIYCSNESQYNVFFDNLQVFHTRGPILEETHYYPFGLVMAGISSKALAFGDPQNKFKFNEGTELANNEFSDGSGLELYETTFRSLDPQVGRFCQIDPLAEATDDWTPYAYCNNNPILFNDPLGLDTTVPINGNQQLTLTDSEARCAVTVSTGKKNSSIPAGLTVINTPGTLMRSNPNYVQNAGTPQNHGKYLPIQTRACVNGCINPGHPDHNHEAGELFDEILVEIVTLGLPVSKLRHLRLLKLSAKRGKTVLGKYPDYIKLANKLNARRCNIPPEIWAKMTPDQQWAANVKFLDRMIARGDHIILSNRVTDINKVTGIFRKELDYLIERGFRVSQNGTRMIR